MSSLQALIARNALRASLSSRLAVALLGAMAMPLASAGESIGTSGSTTFAKLTAWFQDFVNFMDGPFGLAVVIISLILAVCTWMFVPKEGIAGPVLRVVVGAIVILNVTTFIASFRT